MEVRDLSICDEEEESYDNINGCTEILYDFLNTRNYDILYNPENINFDGLYFRYGKTLNKRYFLQVVIEDINSDLLTSNEVLIYHKIYTFEDDKKYEKFTELMKDINNICSGRKLLFCKISNTLYLSQEEADNDKYRKVLCAKEMLLNKVRKCCVCFENTTTNLPCCKGNLCYVCLKKICNKGICECCGDVYKTWNCPLCRNEHKKHINNILI